MLDFDKMFEDYALRYYEEHADDFETPEEMEAVMPDIYEQWADAPSAALGGIAPRAFFERIADPDELVDILIGTSEGEANPCSLLIDRIAQVPETAPRLSALIRDGSNVKAVMLAINLLSDMDAPHPFDAYVAWLTDESIDNEQRELAVEVMTDHADEVAEALYGLLENATFAQKTVIAEILVNAKHDERTYQLLLELLTEGDNVPLYAGYLGKYGDERAAAVLYRMLDDCNYLEYIEIKNAIERMGGVVDDVRDFSQDPYYRALKNLK